MPENPLLGAINRAVMANVTIGNIFAEIYSVDDPSSLLSATYRNAIRAMTTALQENNKKAAVSDVLAALTKNIESGMRSILQASQAAGIENAAAQLKGYGVNFKSLPVDTPAISTVLDDAVTAIVSSAKSQAATIDAIMQAELDTALIVGTDTQSGVLKPSPIANAGLFWAGSLFQDAFGFQVATAPRNLGFQKQAVAALDRKTTDCCIRVHGQIKPMDSNFLLTGSPRFADELFWSPFHYRCRTSVALYLARFDTGLTDRMLNSARIIQSERAAGIYTDRGPANAFIEN